MNSKRKKSKSLIFTVIVEALANIHWHGRELGQVMKALIREAKNGGADVLLPMPNTLKPLSTAEQVIHYVGEAEDHHTSPRDSVRFIPTVMLTENTNREELELCKKHHISDGKIYPFMRKLFEFA